MKDLRHSCHTCQKEIAIELVSRQYNGNMRRRLANYTKNNRDPKAAARELNHTLME